MGLRCLFLGHKAEVDFDRELAMTLYQSPESPYPDKAWDVHRCCHCGVLYADRRKGKPCGLGRES